MLKKLYIKNFALIEEISVEFDRGLTVITGETGAGKSILIGALSMVLGERAVTDLIRTGSDRAVIEAEFDTGDNPIISELFTQNELEYRTPLTIRREITLKGQNRCFVNDMLITTALLKQIGDALVDLHGQHEHQSLLRPELHTDYLDAFAGIQGELAGLKLKYEEVLSLNRQIRDLMRNRDSYAEKREWMTAQLKELQQVNPLVNEDEALIQEEKILMSSEKLHALSKSAYDALYESDPSVLAELDKIHKSLEELKSTDARINEVWESFLTAKIQLEEITRWIGNYSRHVVFDPDRLEQIRVRLVQLQKLKKKFGSLSAAINKKNEIEQWIQQTENFDFELSRLQKSATAAIDGYREQSERISGKRISAGKELEKRVVAVMKNLGMEHAVLKTAIAPVPDPESWLEVNGQKIRADSSGFDSVEFYLSANLGESPKPLAKVASGGEISRIMLSLKSVLAQADAVPTLIFDEIDVGISGRIAQAVGKSLRGLAQSHQVICITHLPQIAAMGDSHFTVVKLQSGGKTVTGIHSLDHHSKILEIAKLLGGDEITETALRNAGELVGLKKK